MTKFSTGKAHLIKRFFQALVQKFFKFPKNLLSNSKKSGYWMTHARAPRARACVIQSMIFRGLL